MTARRWMPLLLAVGLIITLIPSQATSAPKISSGSTCKIVKQKIVYLNRTFTCTKAGKKLVWDKGIPERVTNPIPSPDPSPSPSQKPTSPISQLSNLSDYKNISACKIGNESKYVGLSLSFNRNPYRVKPSKNIKGLIFPIDFPDLVANSDPVKDFAYVTTGVNSLFNAMSEDRVSIDWTIFPKFIRYQDELSKLKLSGEDMSGFSLFNDNALALAKTVVDLSKYDFIVYAPPKSTKREQIALGPAFVANTADQFNATMLDGQSYEAQFPWTTAHEIGHLMGLPDLYSYAVEEQVTLGPSAQFKYMGVYDLMNWTSELTSWSRWLIGFIGDDQMRCLPETSSTTFLTPVETNGGIKGAVIPLSETEGLVLESRRVRRFDTKLTSKSEGVLVFRVNIRGLNGYGPMRVVPRPGWQDGLFRDAPLKLNDKLVTDGYEIKVVETGDFGDVVQVTKI